MEGKDVGNLPTNNSGNGEVVGAPPIQVNNNLDSQLPGSNVVTTQEVIAINPDNSLNLPLNNTTMPAQQPQSTLTTLNNVSTSQQATSSIGSMDTSTTVSSVGSTVQPKIVTSNVNLDNVSSVQGANNQNKTSKKLPWKIIVPIVLAVLVIGGGIGGY